MYICTLTSLIGTELSCQLSSSHYSQYSSIIKQQMICLSSMGMKSFLLDPKHSLDEALMSEQNA